MVAFLEETNRIFATWPHEERQALDADVEALIEARRAAKAARNWKEADRLRDQLKAMGILLEDRKDGTVRWKRARVDSRQLASVAADCGVRVTHVIRWHADPLPAACYFRIFNSPIFRLRVLR